MRSQREFLNNIANRNKNPRKRISINDIVATTNQNRIKSITLTPEENKKIYTKDTGSNLVVKDTNDVIAASYVYFYKGVNRDFSVGAITIAKGKIANIIDQFDETLNDTDKVDIEVLGRVFDLKNWYDIKNGNYIPKERKNGKGVITGYRYGKIVNGELQSRIFKDNINKFVIETKSGYKQRAHAICNKMVKKFDLILSSLDMTCQTVGDIKLLMEDIQHIGRVLQELGIDIDKKFSIEIVMNLVKYINKETKLMSSYLKNNGTTVVESNINDLIKAVAKGDEGVEEKNNFKYTNTLNTNVDLIEDGGRYWEIINKANIEVIEEKVLESFKNNCSTTLPEIDELIQESQSTKDKKEFTKICSQILSVYRSYMWKNKSAGMEEDKAIESLDEIKAAEEKARLHFKGLICKIGEDYGFDSRTILACAITSECISGNEIRRENEKMLARELFKHEFNEFYSEIGGYIHFEDGSSVEVNEDIFYGATDVFGLYGNAYEDLVKYTKEYKAKLEEYEIKHNAILNGTITDKKISDLEIPQLEYLIAEFDENGFAQINTRGEVCNLFANGIEGTVYLSMKGGKVIGEKIYDPEQLTANEKADGEVLIIDKCISRKGAIDVKYYKENTLTDANRGKREELKAALTSLSERLYNNKNNLIIRNKVSINGKEFENVICLIKHITVEEKNANGEKVEKTEIRHVPVASFKVLSKLGKVGTYAGTYIPKNPRGCKNITLEDFSFSDSNAFLIIKKENK